MLKEQALTLYKTAFPEDPDDFAADFINRFFDKSCRYILKNDKIVSMLFLLDGSLVENGKFSPVLYLYAAATHPEYRGEGLMGELIEKAKTEAENKGAFILTKPASASLFDYYGRFGFKTAVFSEDRLINKQTDVEPLGKINRNEYEKTKKNLLENKSYVNLTDGEYTFSYFTLLGNENTVAAVDTSEAPPVVKEFISKDEQGSDKLLAALKTDEAVFRLEGNSPFAMLIPCPEKPIHFMLALD